jgi:hypothetical protein
MLAFRVARAAPERPVLTLPDNHIAYDANCLALRAELARHLANLISLVQLHIAGNLFDGISPLNPTHLLLGIMMAEDIQAALPGNFVIDESDLLVHTFSLYDNGADRLQMLDNLFGMINKAVALLRRRFGVYAQIDISAA